MRINALCLAVLALGVLWLNAACAHLNEKAWRMNPEQARIDCDEGNNDACDVALAEGHFTEQYAHSGRGLVPIAGPK